MITSVFRVLTLILGLGLFACSSSRFSYQDAYKFSNYSYQKNQPADINQEEELYFEPLASTNPNLDPVITSRPVITLPKMGDKKVTKLNKQEKKALKRNIRQEFKETLKAHKTLKKEAKNKKAAMNRKVYSGLIVAGAGLIVAILVSGTLGGLAIIIGVALIAWGLIEEGSI
ncbi:MAG: hypothetical protein MI921_24155 [Cytophagales bacterium]|nr:hypothetical protein [Cytophagales bacterium]